MIKAVALALAVLIAPPEALAQARVPEVGVLTVGRSTARLSVQAQAAFERGLTELGWKPGQTIRIDYRYGESRPELLEQMAHDLARRPVDVIVARATAAIQAAKRATTTVPIVMSASGQDPVDLGFAASLARPGANVTGLTLLNQDLLAKQLELLTEAKPGLSRVAVLGSRAFRLTPKGREYAEAAARTLRLQLTYFNLAVAEDLDPLVARLAAEGIGGMLVRADPFILEPNTQRVVGLALRHGIPAIYWLQSYPQAGGLMSYGAALMDVHYRSAFYVDRILRGARPADLPIEEPTEFALVLNVRTARSMGLTFSPSLLSRADKIIE